MLESDGPGGAEHVLLHLAEGLRNRGHDVVPVLRGVSRGKAWLQAQFRQRGMEPELFYLQHPLDWGCVRGLKEIFERRQIQVVNSHEFTMAVYGAVAARLARRPHIITMHGGKRFANRWRRRAALRWAVRHSGAAVAVSRSAANFLETSLKLAKNSVRVIANGIDFRPGHPARVREELDLAAGEPLIVAVGNLYTVKGHIILLKALAALTKRIPGVAWKAAIVGRGDQEQALNDFLRDAALADRVKLLGYRSDVPDILASADIWCMPSFSEGLPLSLLEAMFAGKAIVASRIGGIPEAVDEGKEGLLVPPGDVDGLAASVERLLLDTRYREALGKAAYARAMRDLRLDLTLDKYEQLYRSVSSPR